MDDLYKMFGGSGMYGKLLAQTHIAGSIASFTHPLTSAWIQQRNQNAAINAVTGSTLHLWQSLINAPKLPNNNMMSIFKDSGYFINNFSTPNPIVASSASLYAKSNLHLLTNQSNLYQTNIWSKSMLAGSSVIEILSKTELYDWNKPDSFWKSFYPHYPTQDKNENQPTIYTTIERFVENVSTVYSEVENFEESQKVKFASNISEVLNHELEAAKDIPSYSLVLEWVLNKYNTLMESAIVTRNIEAMVKIYSELKATTIVGLLGLIILTACLGVVENQGGKLFEYITGSGQEVKPQMINTTVVFNAETNTSKPLLTEPDGRTKVICIIPDCSQVKLGEIVGKYISVSVLYNGSLKKGWCLNEGFVNSTLLP